MRILFVQKEGGIFGAENYQLKVIPGLRDKGVEIEFLRLYTNHQGGKGGEFIDLLNNMGVKTHEINIGKYPSLSVLRKIHRLVKSGYDLIHTHLIHADFHLALTKLIFKGDYVLVSTKHGYDNKFTSVHGFDPTKQKLTPYFAISRWAEKRMDASFTISKGLRDFFIATGLARADKMKLVYYGFEMPDNYLLKNNPEFRRGDKQIMIAGRLVAFKGHKYLIAAFRDVVDKLGDKAKLLIAGTGNLKEELEQQVRELKLEDNVEFLGYSKQVGEYMANSDVVAIPSISEGFGVVFLEAFSAKTPVISWDVPAGNELMTHGESGYLVEPYDVKALSAQLMDILGSPDRQMHITEKAYQNLKQDFSLNRMVEQTMDFYRETLGQRAGRV